MIHEWVKRNWTCLAQPFAVLSPYRKNVFHSAAPFYKLYTELAGNEFCFVEIGNAEVTKSQWLQQLSKSYSLPNNESEIQSVYVLPLYRLSIWISGNVAKVKTKHCTAAFRCFNLEVTYHICRRALSRTHHIIQFNCKGARGILKACADLVSSWYLCYSRFIIFWWALSVNLFACKI